MPSRAILNNCVFFVSKVRKITDKETLGEEDEAVKKTAGLVAALSSNHSWLTYKYLHNYTELDRYVLRREAEEAFDSGWKRINEADVEEVTNSGFSTHAFSMWLYYVFDEEQRDDYTKLFLKLKEELAYGFEPMERIR